MARLSVANLRRLVRNLDYVVSQHAADELEDDNLAVLDLESIMLNGQIVERQRDRATRETKCIVRGRTLDGHEAECVVKLGPTGCLFVITVYRD